MNRITSALGAVFVATAMTAGGAFAADDPSKSKTDKSGTNKADNAQVVPSREDLKPGAAPTVQRMDENVQRQHDRDSGTQPGTKGAAKGVTSQAGATGTTPRVDPSQVRDWASIDKNKDHLIGPEEMEEWLKQAGPQAAPKKS